MNIQKVEEVEEGGGVSLGWDSPVKVAGFHVCMLHKHAHIHIRGVSACNTSTHTFTQPQDIVHPYYVNLEDKSGLGWLYR